MVVTRSQHRRAGTTPQQGNLPGRQQFRAKYKSTDTTHRHRLPDRKRKTVSVVSHSRRKA